MTQAKTHKPETANEGKEKTSLNLEKRVIKSLKYMALFSNTTQTDLITEALSDYIKKWEAENGPIPKKFLQ